MHSNSEKPPLNAPDRFYRAPARQAALSAVCHACKRAMTLQDLVDIATFVADGLHRRERQQQIFPVRDNDQFCGETHIGPILGIERNIAQQHINRQGDVVWHSFEALGRPEKVGELVEISYRDDRVRVSDLRISQSLEK